MGLACAYLVTLALRNPYLRAEDGTFALFVQSELLILFMAGYILYQLPSDEQLTDAEERAAAVLLVALFSAVVLVFLWLALAAFGVRPCCRARRRGVLDEAEQRQAEKDGGARGARAPGPGAVAVDGRGGSSAAATAGFAGADDASDALHIDDGVSASESVSDSDLDY